MKANTLKANASKIVEAFRSVNKAEAALFNKRLSTAAITLSAWKSARNEGVTTDQFVEAVRAAFDAAPTYSMKKTGDVAEATTASWNCIRMACKRAFEKTGDYKGEKKTRKPRKDYSAMTKEERAAVSVSLGRVAEAAKAAGFTAEQIKKLTAAILS